MDTPKNPEQSQELSTGQPPDIDKRRIAFEDGFTKGTTVLLSLRARTLLHQLKKKLKTPKGKIVDSLIRKKAEEEDVKWEDVYRN